MIRELFVIFVILYVSVTSTIGTLTLILALIEFIRDKNRE